MVVEEYGQCACAGANGGNMKFCEVRDITSFRTSFSREPEYFNSVNSGVYPDILKDRPSNAPFRLWVRGGYAGEDAYSQAIDLVESLIKRAQKAPLPAAPENVDRPLIKKAGPVAEKPDAKPPLKEGLQPELFDIRDRQLAEGSARRLASLVHDYKDAVIIRDFKDRIVAWNRGARQMYGYTEKEALGMNIRRLLPKNTPVRGRERIRLSAQVKKDWPVETRRRAKDGRTLDVLLTVSVLRDDNGSPVEIATTERDITAQKKAERKLRRMRALVISAQEKERRRLARDLHDGVGQMLTAVRFRLESLSGETALSAKAGVKVTKVSGLLSDAIAEVRRVSRNLMPSELEDLGLEPALRTLCREFGAQAGVQVTLRTGRIAKTLAPELALAFFRIAQEALNNIGKHSKAATVAVDLFRKGGEIVLRVSDNGVGFAPGGERGPAGRGIGLGSMRERAESVGGSIKVNSTPGIGTTLCVRAPLLCLAGNTP